MKRILCALLLCFVLCALTPSAFADTPPQVQTVSLGIPCTVTVDVGRYGKVYANGKTYTGPTVGSFKVEPGTRVSFVISPNAGYAVSTLTLNGTDVLSQLRNGVYTVTVDRDETLLVRFVKGTSPTPGTNPPNSPKTGDEAALGRWLALLALSALGCVGVTAVGKKKSKAF
ncbi:MAG: hypothetical protein IJV41_07450 [Oscillospiraceae bacterium]|nr:hypothetical protein [Oscillospiraceae bacterium]